MYESVYRNTSGLLVIDEMALRTEFTSQAKTFVPSNSGLGTDCLLRALLSSSMKSGSLQQFHLHIPFKDKPHQQMLFWKQQKIHVSGDWQSYLND